MFHAVLEKAMSAIQAVSKENNCAERVVAFAAVKGTLSLSLQQVLSATFWLKKHYLMRSSPLSTG